jgi:hypothetical protein
VIAAFLALIACELVVELVRNAFDLPFPALSQGCFCLVDLLLARKDNRASLSRHAPSDGRYAPSRPLHFRNRSSYWKDWSVPSN